MQIFWSRMRYLVHRGLRLGGVLLCVGCVQCGWGQEESPHSGVESRPAGQGKTVPQAQAKTSPFGQARTGGGTGTGAVVKSLLPASPEEESSPEGRALGARPVAGTVTSTKSATLSPELKKMDADPAGRDTEEVEASVDRRQKITEDFEEQRRFEREQALAQELAVGDRDQDYNAPDAGLAEESAEISPGVGEAFAEEELDDAALLLDPDLLESGIDAAGRDIEEVEALADLRQEVAKDVEEEQRFEEEQALANESALGDYDQDSGEDPRAARQETRPESAPQPKYGVSAAAGDRDG